MQVLCIGSAVLDITAGVIDRPENWQEKQRIQNIGFSVGGDAANQCIRMADAGVEAGIVSAIGADRNGALIKGTLQERGVDTRFLLTKKDLGTGTALVLLNATGERTIFSVKGAYCALTGADVAHILSSEVQALSIAGLFTEPYLEADGGLLALLSEAQKRRILIFADLASDKLHQGLDGIRPFLPYLDYFLPSLSDIRTMTGLQEPEKNAAFLRNLGCGCVIIKCGGKGCYVSAEAFEGWVRAYAVSPVDTTGAGDCMVALFIAEMLRGSALYKACRFACAGATLSTLYKGASEKKLDRKQIAEWMAVQEGRLKTD